MDGYPQKIFLIGFMGVGKSHWGARLAHHLHYPFTDLDAEIVRAAGGLTVTEIFEQKGEEFFRQLEASCLEQIIGRPGPCVVACGGGAPCFLNNMARMKKAGTVIWLQATPDELLPRLLKEREKRPLVRELDEKQLKAYIIRKIGDRQLFYREADLAVAESSLTEENILQKLLHE